MTRAPLQARSIIVKSALPDTDYVINPYVGCTFGCYYCYASFMGRQVGESRRSWGSYLVPKENAVSLFEREIAKLLARAPHSTLLLSSVTDPYVPAEAKLRLTRGILERAVAVRYPGRFSILTKSPLVIRDIDLFTQLPRVEVGMTVTTARDAVGRSLEVDAPPVRARLRALKTLKAAGLTTYAFVGPLFPHLRYCLDELEELFAALAEAGVSFVYVEHINLKPYIRERMAPFLDAAPEETKALYREARTESHRRVLEGHVQALLEKYRLSLRLQQVLAHDETP